MVLNDDEWAALDQLRSGASASASGTGMGPDEAGFRALLAGAAEKLRIASLPPVPASAPDLAAGAFRVPHLEPCPFCEGLAGRPGRHGPPVVIAEDESTVVLLAPAALGGMPGHVLVVTRRHVPTIVDVTADEAAALGRTLAAAARAVRWAFDPPGVLVQQHNGVDAFQTVPHVHFHVIPKRAGPFPGPEPPLLIPPDERAAVAELVRRHWS